MPITMRVGSGSSAPRPAYRLAKTGTTDHQQRDHHQHGDGDDGDGVDQGPLDRPLSLTAFSM